LKNTVLVSQGYRNYATIR